MSRQLGRVALVSVVLAGLAAGAARADTTTDRSASILVFPKVIADGTRDTIIQISNTSNSVVHAHCFYVNAEPADPFSPPDPISNPPLWQELDFDIWLTKQQPTHWVVSEGRLVDPSDPSCNRENLYCNGSGIDPGRVPPVVHPFTGELKCIEVDASGAPLSGNHLKGEATQVRLDVCNPNTALCEVSGFKCDPANGNDDCRLEEDDANPAGQVFPRQIFIPDLIYDVSKYSAIGLLGNEFNNGDGVLCLGGQPDDGDCPTGGEYNACPDVWILNHFGQGVENPVAGSDSSVDTRVTIVPCTENFETQEPTEVTINLLTWNEFEQAFSSSVQVTCWADLALDEINPAFASGVRTTYQQTRLRSSGLTTSGFMVVGTERHETEDGFTGEDAFNLYVEGQRATSDKITIPGEQLDN
jgi:hypothetical protein